MPCARCSIGGRHKHIAAEAERGLEHHKVVQNAQRPRLDPPNSLVVHSTRVAGPKRLRHVMVERGFDIRRQRGAAAWPAGSWRLRQEQPDDQPLDFRRALPPFRELDAEVADHIVLVDTRSYS